MSQTNQIKQLLEFVQKATKLGKYNLNTGRGIINAINTAEVGLSADEPKEIDYLLSHMEELFLRQKNLNLSPQSQAVYFARIKRAIEDFKKYGVDARSIYSWAPKLRIKSGGKKNVIEKKEELDKDIINVQKNYGTPDEPVREMNGVKLNVLTWRLRPGVLVKIELPEDLTIQDVEKLKKLLDLEIGS